MFLLVGRLFLKAPGSFCGLHGIHFLKCNFIYG